MNYTSSSNGISIYQYDGYDKPASLEVPASIDGMTVTEIGDNTFSNGTYLEVSLPNTLEKIGDYAFYNCENLTSINIPASLASIGTRAFSKCNKLNISIAEENQSFQMLNQAVYSKDGSTLLICPAAEQVTIPSTVTKIADYAFESNKNLKNIVIPESVVELGDHAFHYCVNLSRVDFQGEGLTTIGASCFSSNGFSRLRIPASVKSIGAEAFSYGKDNKHIYFLGDAPQFGSNVFKLWLNQSLTVYYIDGNDTWTQDVFTAQGGENVTWLAWDGQTKSIEGANLVLEPGNYSFTGKQITPAVTLTVDGRALVDGKDYIVEYSNNIKPGNAEVTVVGIGAYEGIIQSSFLIAKAANALDGSLRSQNIMENETINADISGECTYVSEDPSIAAVDDKGRIRGISAGTTKITIRQAETENYLAAVITLEITVNHNEIMGSTVTNGRIEIKCDLCGKVTYKTVPTEFLVYWGTPFAYEYEHDDCKKVYQVGETTKCIVSDSSGADLGEMEIISQSEKVVRITGGCYLNFIADGVAKILVRPKYNPAIGRIFTFYVGDTAYEDAGGSGNGDS